MRMMKNAFFLMLTIFSIALSLPAGNRDTLFQVSTFKALSEGIYEGEITFNELRRHGDFGMGTLLGLDGEVIAVNGRFYKVGFNGKAVPVPGSALSPFAMVTFFSSDKEAVIEKTESLKELGQQLDALLPSKNIFYAIKIEGTFTYIKTRSVEKQKPPYPRLDDVTAKQSVFEFENVRGTIAGFRCPEYIGQTNISGYHFHFITDDRKAGGHLLGCRMEKVRASIDYTENFLMRLPRNQSFLNLP